MALCLLNVMHDGSTDGGKQNDSYQTRCLACVFAVVTRVVANVVIPAQHKTRRSKSKDDVANFFHARLSYANF